MKGTPLGTGYRRNVVRTGIGSAVAALALAAAGHASANEFEVTTNATDGPGSFTAAVKLSREKSGGDEISFSKRLRGKIELPEQVTLKGKVTITGHDYGTPGGKGFRRVVLRGHRGGTELLVDRDSNAALRDLYLDGIAVKASRSVLTVRDSFLDGERTVDETGIASSENLRILRTTVQGFDRGVSAGGIARIDDSTIADNVGSGGIVFGNSADGDVSNSTISGNVVSGSGSFSAPVGGGISANGYGTSARVTNSTIVRNEAIGGGSSGGGLAGNVDVLNSTIAFNRAAAGAGVAGTTNGDADVGNSIVYGNTNFGGESADCATPFTSSGGNVIGTPGDCVLNADDVSGVDPLLGPLGDNGGLTETMAIGQGSPAIGLAVQSTATKFDQRGVKRDSDPDAGAVERKG